MSNRGPKPGSPNAKNGGNAVKEKYGKDYYKKIGTKGGAATKETADYNKMGTKGGNTTKENCAGASNAITRNSNRRLASATSKGADGAASTITQRYALRPMDS